MERIEKIQKWYKERIGLDVAGAQFIDIPERILPKDLQNGMFAVFSHRYEDHDFDALRNNYEAAFGLLEADPEMRDIQGLRARFDEVLDREIKKSRERAEGSRDLIDFISQGEGDRIYVAPLGRKMLDEAERSGNDVLVSSALAHEMLHNEQTRLGLNRKFPNIKEGPAWLVQLLYGADHVGVHVYQELSTHSSNGSSSRPSDRELAYLQNVNFGLKIAVRHLGIKFSGRDISSQLKKFSRVFEPNQYARMEAEIVYEFVKSEMKK